MSEPAAAVKRSERRAREHSATRAAILEAARRVAAREGARDLSLRGVASEAGFAPAALSGLALLARAGRLEALGFTAEEVVDRLEARFAS